MLFMLAVTPTASGAADLYATQRSFAHPQALPLNLVFKGMKVPFFGGQLTQGYSWSETGYRQAA